MSLSTKCNWLAHLQKLVGNHWQTSLIGVLQRAEQVVPLLLEEKITLTKDQLSSNLDSFSLIRTSSSELPLILILN